ncbi:unnamed protein product, partial [Adineta steineri]
KSDLDTFLKYAHNDKDRQRHTLQSLFLGNKLFINFNEEQEWNEHARHFCTIQQWAQLRYRIARLEELFDLIEGKIDYVIQISDNLLRTKIISPERLEKNENV